MSLWNAIKELFTGPRIQTQFEQLLLEEEARKQAESAEPVKEETVANKKKPAAKPAAQKPAKGKAAAKPAEKAKPKKKK